MSMQKEEDLKSALEYQIDIVLRLEEERLRLLKETKLQKEKIRELTVRCETSTRRNAITVETESQCQQSETINIETQTEEVEVKAVSQVEASEQKPERNLLEEANALITKYSETTEPPKSEKSSRVNSSIKKQPKVAVRNLKFVSEKNKENTDRSNIAYGEVTQKNQNLRNEKEILTQEIIDLNREINRMKIESRLAHENMKKFERDNMELRKAFEQKADALERYKAENTEMSTIINSDKYKSVKTIEGELRKALGHNKELVNELSVKINEKKVMEVELKQFREVLHGLKQEYEKKSSHDISVNELMQQIHAKDNKIKDLVERLKSKEDEAESKQKTINELIHDNDELNNHIDYFKGMAKNSKTHAEKALADVEVYRKILQNKSISQSDILSLSQTQETI